MNETPPLFPIHDLCGELERSPSLHWAARDITKVDRIVVHHTATELSAGQTVKSHIHAINRQHIKDRGWPSIPYHYVIGRQGVVWQCNDLTSRTYHSGNAAMNARSVGVCLLGKMTTHDPTPEQLAALRWLVDELGWPAIGHREVVHTACPGPWWQDKKEWVNAGIKAEAVQVEAEPEPAEGCVGSVQEAWGLVWSWLGWQWERLREWRRGES